MEKKTMPDDHQQAKRSRYFFDPLDCRNQEEPRHLMASNKDEQPAPSSSAYDFFSSFLTNAFFSRPPNIRSYGHLLFLLDDVPESVKPVLGEYLLTVAKHYLAAYNDKLGGGSTSAAMSPEAVTRQLTPEYRRTLATLAEANQAAAATGNGHRRVRDLDGKITDGHERLARAPMIEEEKGFEEGEAAEEEAEDSSPEDDKVLVVLTEDEKIKAFYERIGYHFHVGGGDDDAGDGHQPKPSSAASSSSSSSPAKTTTTTAAATLNTVTNEEVQQQLTTTSKPGDGGDKEGNGKCPTMTTTTTTSSLSSIFDSAEFVRFFGAHPKIGK